jgi:hypothetical protein
MPLRRAYDCYWMSSGLQAGARFEGLQSRMTLSAAQCRTCSPFRSSLFPVLMTAVQGPVFALPVGLNVQLASRKQLELVNGELVQPLELARLPTLAALDANAGENTNFLQCSYSGCRLTGFPGLIPQTQTRCVGSIRPCCLAQKCQRWALATRKSRNTWTRAMVLSSSG